MNRTVSNSMSISMSAASALAMLVVSGCSRSHDDREPAPSPSPSMTSASPGSPGPAPAPTTPTTSAPTGIAGSQQDLAKEMDTAEKNGTWQDLRHKWQGKQVTWSVTRLTSLCHDAALCNVRPFATVQGVHYGWMPKLELSSGEYDKLTKGCGASEPCKVTFTGVLSDFQISGDAPTSLKFSDVTIVSAG